MTIEFNEEKHIYTVDGKVVPSVTDICNPITSEHYGAINAAVLEMASRRGTAVHEATQLIDLGVMPDDDPEVDAYVNAYLDFLLDYKPKWEYIEYIGFCDQFGGYCGTVDRAGRVGDEYWVLDIKTTASPNKEQYMATCCQTEAYALMIGKDCICKRKILYLRKDGSYRIVDCETKEQEIGLDPYYLFSNLCSIKSYINKVKETKREKKPKESNQASS